MKMQVMMTLAALMFMAPASYAQDRTTPPTGPNAKGLETTQPAKEMAKTEVAKAPKKNKKKLTKPLSPKEREEMERRTEVTEPVSPEENGVK